MVKEADFNRFEGSNPRTLKDMKETAAKTTKTIATDGTSTIDDALASLLDAWVSHDDLRREGAPIATLAASHFSMDSTRLEARRHVRSYCPAA